VKDQCHPSGCLANAEQPVIVVEDGTFENRSEIDVEKNKSPPRPCPSSPPTFSRTFNSHFLEGTDLTWLRAT